jgi:hypothetical protein
MSQHDDDLDDSTQHSRSADASDEENEHIRPPSKRQKVSNTTYDTSVAIVVVGNSSDANLSLSPL